MLHARLRCEVLALRRVAQEAEQPAQLHEGLTARRLDRAEGLARRPLLTFEHTLGRLGLHDHHADAVGDDVVQLARDAGALLDDGGADPFLAGALEPGGPLALGRGRVSVAPELAADEPRQRERDRGPEIAAALGREEERAARGERRGSHDEPAARVAPRPRRVEGEHQRQEAGERSLTAGIVEQRAGGGSGRDDDEHGGRPAPAQAQRQGRKERERGRRGLREGRAPVEQRAGPDLGLVADRQSEGDDPVGPAPDRCVRPHAS